jgi:hypothetical protein
MDVYKELMLIDRFEESHGNSEAVRRACDFMISYLAAMTTPFPEVAERGRAVAIRYKQGLALNAELENARKSISDFLRERSARTNYDTPEYCIVHAVEGMLACYLHPEWGGGASELVSNFLDVTDKFQSDHSFLKRLLEEKFSA